MKYEVIMLRNGEPNGTVYEMRFDDRAAAQRIADRKNDALARLGAARVKWEVRECRK